jgi:neprilysin
MFTHSLTLRCDDFYEFACGTFVNQTVIPDGKDKVDAYSLAEEQIVVRLRAILDEPITNGETKPFQDAKKFYKSCMDITQIKKIGFAPIFKKLNELGGWPVAMSKNPVWKTYRWTWQKAVTKLRETGFNVDYFVSYQSESDGDDPTMIRVRIRKHVQFKNLLISYNNNNFQLGQPKLGLERELLISKNMTEVAVEAYHEKQLNLALKLGAEKSKAQEEMRKVLDFEIKLAEVRKPEIHP